VLKSFLQSTLISRNICSSLLGVSILLAFSKTPKSYLTSGHSPFVHLSTYCPSHLTPFFLQITDQPRDRPGVPVPVEEREKHVILSLRAPSPSEAKDTVLLVNAVFHLIDSLNKLHLRPETKTKLKKTREDLDKSMKVEAEKEQKEEVRFRSTLSFGLCSNCRTS